MKQWLPSLHPGFAPGEAEVQASAISFDTDDLLQKCKQIKSAMQMMNDEFVECIKLPDIEFCDQRQQ